MMPERERSIIERAAGAERIARIALSYRHHFGCDLVPAGADMVEALWNLPAVVLAHGTQDDPVFYYGNRTALDGQVLDGEGGAAIAGARFMTLVAQQGWVDDYAGIRITLTGRRFRMEHARVWNLIDETGQYCGQAASFDRWVWLDKSPAGD